MTRDQLIEATRESMAKAELPAKLTPEYYRAEGLLRDLLGRYFGSEAAGAEFDPYSQVHGWEETEIVMSWRDNLASRIQVTRHYTVDPRKDLASEMSRVRAEHAAQIAALDDMRHRLSTWSDT